MPAAVRGDLRLGLAHGLRRRCHVRASDGSIAEQDHLAGLKRSWLLTNGREQHEPDSHCRKRNPEGRTERNPERRKRDVSLPGRLVGNDNR